MKREEAIKLVKEVTGMSLDWDDAHYEALQMAIKALEKETKEKWIPVSERLPNEYEEVLVTDDAGGMANIEIDFRGRYANTGEGFWIGVKEWLESEVEE